MTKWRGTVAADGAFTFEEYECAKGDEVETPVSYEAIATKAAVTGKPLLANLPMGEKATVAIDLISVDKPKLVAGAHYTGTCFSPLPFRVKVSSLKGDAFVGSVEWPTLKAATKCSGKLVPGADIVMQEESLISGDAADVPVPQHYAGKAQAGGGYAGECGAAPGQKEGTFRIKA